MSATLLARDGLLPRPPGGLAPGALLALLVHAGLVAAIAWSVQWRSATVDAVGAELWAAVPQTAAPRAVEAPSPPVAAPKTPTPPKPVAPPKPPPAPAPVAKPAPKVEPATADAQIAVERARRDKEDRERQLQERSQREKAERAKAERVKAERDGAERARVEREAAAEKLKQAEATKKQKREADERAEETRKEEEEKRLADLREANLKRMLGQAGASGSPAATGTALRDAAPSASYAGRLVAAIKPNIVFADNLPGNPAAEVEVSATPTGMIIARRLRKSSGNKEWDDAVLRAIDRTGSLPRDTDGRVPASFVISFRPQE